jgi:hypothetical protein
MGSMGDSLTRSASFERKPTGRPRFSTVANALPVLSKAALGPFTADRYTVGENAQCRFCKEDTRIFGLGKIGKIRAFPVLPEFSKRALPPRGKLLPSGSKGCGESMKKASDRSPTPFPADALWSDFQALLRLRASLAVGTVMS